MTRRRLRVRMILPALTEATSPFFRPIKYSLFPPLGLATLAGYLGEDDEVTISDEHVERLVLDDEPDLVVIQVYITSARRSYEIADLYRARGCYVTLGGLQRDLASRGSGPARGQHLPGTGRGHLAPLPRRFSRGPAGAALRLAALVGIPPIRRDLIKRRLYLVPNSIVVSRGCPHVCGFCYKVAFFWGSIFRGAAGKEDFRSRLRPSLTRVGGRSSNLSGIS